MDNSSPFLPGRPAPADLFFGRVAVLDRLAQRARSAAAGRLNIAYLSGERGIGKTSLISFLRQFLRREFDVLGVHVFLSGAQTLEEALHRIFDQILKIARQENLTSGVTDPFRLSHTSAALGTDDLTLRAPDRELLAIGEHLDSVVHALMQRLGSRYRSMMLVLDDVNEVASAPPFAHWLKGFVDSASTSGAEPPLFLLLAGHEESRQALIGSNQSLERVLQGESLGPWTQAETEDFFRYAFELAGRPATDSALRAMSNFCEGRPALAHRLGDATFRGDRDGHVTEEDAMTALFGLHHGSRDVTPLVEHAATAPAKVGRQEAVERRRNRQLLSVLRSLI